MFRVVCKYFICIYVQGYGYIQSIGGDGYTSNAYCGGGGSGGRIALYFRKNETFVGSWDVYGGTTNSYCYSTLKTGYGASGTVFMYHKGRK